MKRVMIDQGSAIEISRYFFSLYSHHGQTVATLLGSCFIHPLLEGKISLWDQVLKIVGSQSMASQCLITTIQHKPEVDTLAITENNL